MKKRLGMIGKCCILLAEKDDLIREAIFRSLDEAGFEVIQANCGDQALRIFHEQAFDLVILSVSTPIISAVEICGSIRSESALPILLLAEKGDDQLILEGVDAGANDFLLQPLRAFELLARVQMLLNHARATAGPLPGWILHSGDLTLDLHSHSLQKDGRRMVVTRTEMRLLSCLMRRAGETLSKDELLKTVWGCRNVSGDYNLVDTTIRRLRQHIEDDPRHPQYIETVWGFGYRFNGPPVEGSG